MSSFRSIALVVAALSVAFSSGAAQVPGTTAPRLAQGRVPLINWYVQGNLGGQVTLRVTVHDGVPTSVVAVSADPVLLGGQTVEHIKQWRFEPGSQGEFDLRVRYVIAQKQRQRCERDRNPRVSATVPTDVEVSIEPWGFCDPSTTIEPTGLVRRTLTGVVRCSCRGNRPLAGVLLHISQEPANPDGEGVHRTLRTDADGRFRVDGLPDGQYGVGLEAEGFYLRRFVIRISRDAPAGPPIEWRLEEQPPPVPPPPTTVTAADIPLYPPSARANGIEGVVKLRLSMSHSDVLDVNAEAESNVLAEAAIENVGTWSLTETTVPVVHVTFTYKLLPGDCSSDQQPRLTIRFPGEVEVTAKRIVKCG